MNYSPRSQVGLFFTSEGYTVAFDEHQKKLRTNIENGGVTSVGSIKTVQFTFHSSSNQQLYLQQLRRGPSSTN